ncbi:unnamed protein product [Amoebophrya sp. A120]|nr:unnamed protein product [Amoebophrya sp. A120]|eukprot:GSA120T00015550001.1
MRKRRKWPALLQLLLSLIALGSFFAASAVGRTLPSVPETTTTTSNEGEATGNYVVGTKTSEAIPIASSKNKAKGGLAVLLDERNTASKSSSVGGASSSRLAAQHQQDDEADEEMQNRQSEMEKTLTAAAGNKRHAATMMARHDAEAQHGGHLRLHNLMARTTKSTFASSLHSSTHEDSSAVSSSLQKRRTSSAQSSSTTLALSLSNKRWLSAAHLLTPSTLRNDMANVLQNLQDLEQGRDFYGTTTQSATGSAATTASGSRRLSDPDEPTLEFSSGPGGEDAKTSNPQIAELEENSANAAPTTATSSFARLLLDSLCMFLPFFMFLSPGVSVFYPAWKQADRNSANAGGVGGSAGASFSLPPLPLTSQTTQCFLWLLFGLHLSKDAQPVVLIPNVVGLVLGVVYLYLYPKFLGSAASNSPTVSLFKQQYRLQMNLVILIAVIGVVLHWMAFVFEQNTMEIANGAAGRGATTSSSSEASSSGSKNPQSNVAHDTIGYLACLIGLLLLTSPLFVIQQALETGNPQVMGSFVMNLFSFSCAFVWTIQGVLINQKPVLIQNFCGTVANGLALAVRWYLEVKFGTNLVHGSSMIPPAVQHAVDFDLESPEKDQANDDESELTTITSSTVSTTASVIIGGSMTAGSAGAQSSYSAGGGAAFSVGAAQFSPPMNIKGGPVE